jgi:hypothetical protein
VVGRLEPSGLRPTFLHKFEKRGITLPYDLFVLPGAELPEFTARAAS